MEVAVLAEVLVGVTLDDEVVTGVAAAKLASAGRHRSRVWQSMMLDKAWMRTFSEELFVEIEDSCCKS